MDNQHYRYCFYCNKWKTKSEINEIDLGGGNKSFNCNICRKDLGPQIIIFHCHHHSEIIMKVWGTLENENKEKIFYSECPEEKKEEQNPTIPNQPQKTDWKMITWIIFFVGTTLLLVPYTIYNWFKDKKKKK